MTSRCRDCNAEIKFDNSVRGKNGGRIPLNPDGTRHDCPNNPAPQAHPPTQQVQPQAPQPSKQDKIDQAVQAKLDRLDRIAKAIEDQNVINRRIADYLEIIARAKV